MKKSDLSSGMKLVTTDGKEYIYFKDFHYGNDDDILLGKGTSWNSLNDYNDDLIHQTHNRFTIQKIYSPDHPYTVSEFFGQQFNYKNEWILVWERYPEREITLAINVKHSDTIATLTEQVMDKLALALIRKEK